MVSAPLTCTTTTDAIAESDTPSIIDLVLRGQDRLNDLLRDERRLLPLIRRMLALSIAGLVVHGLIVGTTIQLIADRDILSLSTTHAALWMPIAFVGAFLGALSICLPSFYFYTQLSGLDASFRLVTAQALRAQATSSVMLFGALPMYVAVALASVLHFVVGPETTVIVGLLMPFAVGLLGIRAVYKGFSALAAHLPITHQRRGNFIRRLVLAWGAVYTAVAPVALFRLAEALSKLM
jgi:hypothetical protein